MTTAEKVAKLFKDDGQTFCTDDGRYLEDVCREYGADLKVGRKFVDWVTGETVIYEIPVSHATTDSLFRYVFKDGSAIVIVNDAWDIEGDQPFTWRDA